MLDSSSNLVAISLNGQEAVSEGSSWPVAHGGDGGAGSNFQKHLRGATVAQRVQLEANYITLFLESNKFCVITKHALRCFRRGYYWNLGCSL